MKFCAFLGVFLVFWRVKWHFLLKYCIKEHGKLGIVLDNFYMNVVYLRLEYVICN